VPVDLQEAEVTAPGSVPQPNDRLEQRIKALEKLVDELQRKDLSNATVGQGGRIRGLYKDGTQAFAYGTDPADGQNRMLMHYTTGDTAIRITPGSPLYGSSEQLVIKDLANHRILGTDELAGYGIVEPIFANPMVAIPGLNMVSGVEQKVATCKAFFYQPAYWSDLLCTNFLTMTGVSCRLSLSDGTNTFFSSATTSAGNGSTHGRFISIPSDFINKQNVELAWLATTTGSGTMSVAATRSHGISQALFVANPGFQ
jgi:hypothetical protein